jgi:hypothetical protein
VCYIAPHFVCFALLKVGSPREGFLESFSLAAIAGAQAHCRPACTLCVYALHCVFCGRDGMHA